MCKISAEPFVSHPQTGMSQTNARQATDRGRVSHPRRTPFADRCAKFDGMRIETGGKYAWRTDLYDDVGELLGESTRSGAVDGACEFTTEMLPALERAVEHPDMTEDLAEVLSTQAVTVEYEIETGLGVR